MSKKRRKTNSRRIYRRPKKTCCLLIGEESAWDEELAGREIVARVSAMSRRWLNRATDSVGGDPISTATFSETCVSSRHLPARMSSRLCFSHRDTMSLAERKRPIWSFLAGLTKRCFRRVRVKI